MTYVQISGVYMSASSTWLSC